MCREAFEKRLEKTTNALTRMMEEKTNTVRKEVKKKQE